MKLFEALKIRNYRMYFIGQAISLCGTWMQTIGQDWLVLQITKSGTQLGIVSAFQFPNILHNIFGLLSLFGLIVSIYLLGTELGFKSQIVKHISIKLFENNSTPTEPVFSIRNNTFIVPLKESYKYLYFREINPPPPKA